MIPTFDVAVIGAGIVGLAHAWMAARRKLRVVVLERSPAAHEATVRNFGMIWPIGQPSGESHAIALRSRELWLELRQAGALDVEECGSIHLAHQPDELAVLEEFQALRTHECHMLRPDETVRRSPLANPEGLLGGMWSPTELRVDPRSAAARLAAWLESTQGVTFHFNTVATEVERNKVRTADGRQWAADQFVVCSGADLRTLFADKLQQSGLRLCKLQMLKTVAQRSRVALSPHIASGLTLRHYSSFAACPSLTHVKQRIARQAPELDRFGIHVMASQQAQGDVILGDSHEYGNDISPFDKTQIDELILRELRKVIRLDNWTIQERWHGIYAKHPEWSVFEETVNGVRIFVGTGGAGMTMSFGLADRAWRQWQGQ